MRANFPIRRLFLAAMALTCAAQSPINKSPSPATESRSRESVNVDVRRDELAKVKEMLSDRDPLMRLANLEAIINSGDALRTQLALRLAFQSEDADLHALAMRGYIASRKEVALDIQLPAADQRGYEEALADPQNTTTFMNSHPYIDFLAKQGFRVHFRFSKYDVTSTTGTIQDSAYQNQDQLSSFAISGDRLSASVQSQAFGLCRVDFRPVGNMFKGSLSCSFFNSRSPKLDVSAPVF